MSNLKLLDRSLGNVLCCGSDRLIADIDAVHLNPRGSSETSSKRDGRESVLGRIKVASILDLHSRLKLCQVEEIAPIDGKIVDLICVEYTLNRGLFGIDVQFGSSNFN